MRAARVQQREIEFLKLASVLEKKRLNERAMFMRATSKLLGQRHLCACTTQTGIPFCDQCLTAGCDTDKTGTHCRVTGEADRTKR